MRRLLTILASFLLATSASASEQRFPAPDFQSGYKLPQTQAPPTPNTFIHAIDVALLLTALGLSTWFVYRRRSRGWVLALTIASVLYFGFHRKGCVCPVGSIQNVAMAAGPSGYSLPWMVAAFFALPLIFALFAGRVFCAGVCPLGAIQDLVLFKPIQVPRWIEETLGLFAYAYLGLAAIVAFNGSDFLICRFDPFVGFFRFSGTAHMLIFGATLLILSMFIGRTYCRFLCPYGILLKLLSPFASKRVTITPDACIDCRLCEQSCPFGAIRTPTPTAKPADRARSRREVIRLALITPAILALFCLASFFAAKWASQTDATILLAQRIANEERGIVTDTTKESAAFRATGKPVDKLYDDARKIRSRYAWSGIAFGAWMGLVLSGKLITHSVRKRRVGYTADPGACLGCARCYSSCPVDERNVHLAPLREAQMQTV